MAPVHISVNGIELRVTAQPLTPEAFASFGAVVQNPRPDVQPADFAHTGPLPFDAVSANQSTAIKYQHVTRVHNGYETAPSGVPGVAVMNMFVCAARKLQHQEAAADFSSGSQKSALFGVNILERHPFTTQTFTPLSVSGRLARPDSACQSLPDHRLTANNNRYLVIVAPNMPPAATGKTNIALSSPPDLSRIRAFVATLDQAVTYGAGTWHAPMVALGPAGTAVDFIVTQFANGVSDEDCQEVTFGSSGDAQIVITNLFSIIMSPALESIDAKNKLEDLSGITIVRGENPYKALINASRDDPAEIQSLYSTHRVTRNEQQKAKFLAGDFKEVLIDPYLFKLETERGFSDPRTCLVFWARPPEHVIRLAAHLQALLKKAAPTLWLMPTHRMHMTTLEVTHSRTAEEIRALIQQMRPAIPALTDITFTHRCRLVKPMLSYDLSAIALSFLPASGEPQVSPKPLSTVDRVEGDSKHGEINDAYTYHHLRKDVYDLATSSGVEMNSRYVVPSAHITLGRYMTQDDHATAEMREAWVKSIDAINGWLEKEVWDRADGRFVGEWLVGQERGLDARAGTLWYGGGRTIMLGEGF
ncbi:ureidoglycolate hydrolase-domain-containing protein [Coniella lustricola]|uniref:Ureidoglycolate hydrolase-domain-containing protein n=1 Tax=Coniella lustricola TaxID=2025994 RepID=A0A2T3AHY2_9PEZI|nr:ureidoglycolate hydrolase-domain-containing protein [Coniella lustricola]